MPVGEENRARLPGPLRTRYAQTLARYIATGGAAGLSEPYRIAREAADGGATALDVVRMHMEAQALLAVDDPPGRRRAAALSGEFLLEAMAPFEQGDISRRSANVTLVQSYGELRQANEDLRQVTHAIAHDLQQPLFAAAGHVYALSRRLATQGGPPAELEKAADAIRLAQEMLAGLLEFARAGSAQPPEEVDLGALAREIADQVTQNRGLPADAVEIGPLPVLLAPPLQLRQIVQNLLDNALKFTGGDGPVRLAAELDRDQWVVSVTDHGLGIDPADAERIFDIFQRATDRHPGTGIGLAVCRRALQRMGGRIWVSPNPGGGSIFRFTIPERPRA